MTKAQFTQAYVRGWYDCARSNGLHGYLWDVPLEETDVDMSTVEQMANHQYSICMRNQPGSEVPNGCRIIGHKVCDKCKAKCVASGYFKGEYVAYKYEKERLCQNCATQLRII